ncbi:MAG TPA: hypothetical protein VFG73_04505 [Rhodanobacteraceae bacterium]|nr:hypothetical protein [Rhodanobacteraceae bacterium]
MTIGTLAKQAREFSRALDDEKHALKQDDFGWYPYGTLNNFDHLRALLGKTKHEDVLSLAVDGAIADIGAADGDTAFFLESLGYSVDAIDYPPTNYNGCRGLRVLREARKSAIGIHEIDLDAHFELPGARYGLAFFLGILYHLKNPYGAMESLSRIARHALVSTRVTRYNVAIERQGQQGLNSKRVELTDIPAAYLVDSHECNNDPTNFWMFSESGLKRLFDRCGWDVLEYTSLGDTKKSDPATAEHDERAFCLLRSRHWQP